MSSLLHPSVFIHLLAACIWVGGSIFLAAAFVPFLRHPTLGAHARPLFGPAARRFRTIGWICLILLVGTGFLNLAARGIDIDAPGFWSSPLGSGIALKIGLLAVIMIGGLFHDFLAGPRAVAAREADPEGPEARKWRAVASWIGRINLLLSLIIVWVAVGLFH